MDNMEVVELIKQLKASNKSINVNKKVYYYWLVETVNAGAPLVSNLAQEVFQNLAGYIFTSEAYWEEIV